MQRNVVANAHDVDAVVANINTLVDKARAESVHGALVRGYDVTLVADAHTTEDMRQWGGPLSPEQAIAYTNLYWSFSKSPGRSGDTVPAAEVDFASS